MVSPMAWGGPSSNVSSLRVGGTITSLTSQPTPTGGFLAAPESASAISLEHGTTFAHVGYDFGKMEPARQLYPALNHLLFNPVLPYELYTGPERRGRSDVRYRAKTF